MIIERKINGIVVGVDPFEADAVYFNEKDAENLEGDDIDSIRDYLMKQNGDEMFPFSCNFEITNVCNFKCPFCYINTCDSKKTTWTFDEAKLVIDMLIEKGMLLCTLTGGEVMLNPDFAKIYTYLKEHGVLVNVFTNGSLVTNEIIDLFKKYPPYLVEISIYGFTDYQFFNVTGNNPYYKNHIFDLILSLKYENINVRCKTPITSITHADEAAILNWCKKHSISYYTSSELLDTYSGNSTDSYKAPANRIQEEMNRKITNDKSESNNIFGYKKAFDCPAGKSIVYISFDKCVYPCMSAYGINELGFPLFVTTPRKAIEHLYERVNEMRGVKLSKCSGCKLNDVCNYCIVKDLKKEQPPCLLYSN